MKILINLRKYKMIFFYISIPLMLITKAQQSILLQKLVYQVDMSEYCKRRVLPSIFLAKNSVDSSAFVMHFTQKEIPYSCPISVRVESGYNILMVIRVLPLEGMKRRCEANKPEFLVYEMGETFGGYWGPFGHNIFKQESVEPKIYTLKTTQTISTTEEPVVTTTENIELTETSKQDQKMVDDSEDSVDEDFISVDVPLVNVSGKFMVVDKDNDTGSGEDEDAMFDLQYNVTPEPGVDYATSVIPIVQFSVKSHRGWRKEGDDSEPRFDLDIVEKYTPDHRLTLPHYKSTTRLKYRKFSPRTTKRRHPYFSKNSTKGKLQTLGFKSQKYTGYNFPTTKAKASKSLRNVSRFHAWKTIEELIEKVNLTTSLQKEDDKKLSVKKETILHKISDMKHNFSIYLEPNLSLYDSPKSQNIYTTPKSSDYTTVKLSTLSTLKLNKTDTKYAIKAKASNQVTSKLINKSSTSVGYFRLEKLDSVPSVYEKDYPKGHTTSSTVEVISKKVFKASDNSTNSTQMGNKSLVDHESWENVVQAAPDMAVLLNITKDEIKKHIVVTNNGTAHNSLGSKKKRRKKREIHAIEINDSRPHNVTTKNPILSTTTSSFGVAEIQEFSQLIEVQDDKIHGRVALKFLRKYVGPVIYNICELNTTSKQQHVHLFNASRIVIAINNFANLASLSMILTSARTLVPGELECPETNIECQVAGARVCIDAMSACDGVPNCGSYDIYDEDRLMCGESEGLQHNVYVAAFTFLAVLLTALYSVHYWLRRCVPRVADAFFIYTNGTENILSLEPKMRSPHDLSDSASKLFFHPSMLDNDIDIMPKEIKPNCCQRYMRKLCCGFTLRKSTTANPSSKTDGEENIINFDPKVNYSFTKLQIQNMIRKTKMSPQSGNSIELMNIMDVQVTPPTIPLLKSIDSILTLEEPLPEDYKDELGMLKFLKNNRRYSTSSVSNEVLLGIEKGYSISSDKNSEEVEIKTVEYNRTGLAEPGPSGVKPKNKIEQLSEPGPSGIQTTKQVEKPVTKRLRFDDNTTMIPASIAEVDEEEEEIDEQSKPQRHGTFFDTVMGKQKFFGGFEDDNEPPLPKEHKRFWGGSGKSKKPSRPKNTH